MSIEIILHPKAARHEDIANLLKDLGRVDGFDQDEAADECEE